MAADDLLRLAWEAEHDGRRSLRDALLTLAIVESGPDDDWADRCRVRLVAERPNHFLGEFASVVAALADPRVISARVRLRLKYPPGRVSWLLLRAQAARGRYTGRPEAVGPMVEDLAWLPAEAENVRLDAAQKARGPLAIHRVMVPSGFTIAYPPYSVRGDRLSLGSPEASAEWGRSACGVDPDGRRFHYFSVLFALALVLAAMPEDPIRDGD